MKSTELELPPDAAEDDDDGPGVSLVDLLTWLGASASWRSRPR